MATRMFAATLTAGALLWVVVLVAAPTLSERGRASPAMRAIYSACGLICHQRPARSFAVSGVQFPVCARCFGLYAAAAGGAVAAWLMGAGRLRAGSRGVRFALALAAAPTIATVAIERSGISDLSNMLRATAAIPLGAAAGWICVRLLIDESGERMHEGQVRT